MALGMTFSAFEGDPLQSFAAGGMFLFLSVLMICIFSFISIAVWTDARRREREAYYKSEMLKKIAETGGGSNPALEYLRERERIAEKKRIAGFKIGGLVNIAVGIGVMILLYGLVRPAPVYLSGVIPLLIGVALLVCGYWMGPKAED